jgi:hypothetical protein
LVSGLHFVNSEINIRVQQAIAISSVRKTAAFYAVLLALVAVDLILLFWMFDPFSHFGTADRPRHAVQDTTMVDDSGKPSPFEFTTRQAAALNHPRDNRPAVHRPAQQRRGALVARGPQIQ